jgi:hypothetical protein
VSAYGYGEGYYYTQGSYYAQSYYQASYASLGSLITGASYAPGAGGYAPSSYVYYGGGGGGGLVINGSTVAGAHSTGGGNGGNGGAGYGGGGGGTSDSGTGGAGAPGVVYVEWYMPPASCTVSITPNPATYSSSDTATLTWTSSNADSWTQINSVGTLTGSGGSFTVPRTATTDYSCYAQGSGGSDGWHSYTLTVSTPDLPTATITSSLGSSMQVGQSSAITATFSPESGDALTAANIDSPLGTGLGADENPDNPKVITFTPTSAGTYTFYARAKTSYFTSWNTYASTTVTVQAPCTLDGVTIQSGESATFYSSQTASGQLCSSIAQSRTCTDGVLSGSGTYQYSTCSCAPIYSCSANSVTYTDASCSTSTVTTCVAPAFCSPGSASCLYPEPSFNAGADTTGHLQAAPILVPPGDTTTLYWSVSNVESCSVTGSNGDSWTGGSSGASGKTSAAITEQTVYSLACTGLDGSSVSESVTVNVLPIFQEL